MNFSALLAAPLLAAALLAVPGIASAETVAAPAPLSAMIAMTDDGVATATSGSAATASDEALFGKRIIFRSWF